jgi:ACS family sodium-dependent inorganic phosphate cotransporter
LVVLLLCAAVFISYIDRTNISVGAISMQAQLGWSETQKGMALSSFFIGYILMMMAGGALANRYGGKVVLGLAVVWWSLCTVLTPPAALVSMPVLIAARIALGLGEAAVFPASFNMISRWVPPLQVTRAVALLASMTSLGPVFALPVTGALIRGYGWPVPFYAFGAVGLVWAVAWFTRVSGGSGADARSAEPPPAIPWARLLKLPAVWAIVVAHFGFNWSLYVLLAWLPSYFKSTFGVTIANAGLLSAAPALVAFVMANVAGYVADRLLRAGQPAGVVRKAMTATGLAAAAAFLLMVPLATTVTAGVVLMSCASGSAAIAIAGFPPNCFDIAPRYADVIYGFSNTFATLPGIFGVFITGWLVDRTGGFAAGFYLTAGVSVVAALVFLVLGSGVRQID